MTEACLGHIKLGTCFQVLLLLMLLAANRHTFVRCDNWEYKLVHDILEHYDPSIRPSLSHNMTLNVTFGLALAQLIDVDERNMIITTNCWLNQGWIDHKLKWDPSKYDGIKFVHIPAEKLWKPDILLVNNADAWAKTSSISTNAIVKYNGNVTWLSTVIFKSSCSINVKYFPFDEQSCDMIFASWTFDGFFLDIDVNSNEGDVTNYIKNGEWHLVKLLATKNLKHYSCCEEPYPEIFYRLIIRRRPLFYVFNMVFPCLLITLVAFLGFYLPPGSSEKVSIGITTLLSITVFLMLVAESMPPTSEQLPLLGIYYAVTIGIVSFSTTMAVITLNVNNKGNRGREVPKIVRIIFFKYLARIFRTNLLYDKKTKQVNLERLKAYAKPKSKSKAASKETPAAAAAATDTTAPTASFEASPSGDDLSRNFYELRHTNYANSNYQMNPKARLRSELTESSLFNKVIHTNSNIAGADYELQSKARDDKQNQENLLLEAHDSLPCLRGCNRVHQCGDRSLYSQLESDEIISLLNNNGEAKSSNNGNNNTSNNSNSNTNSNNEKQSISKSVAFDKILLRPTSILKSVDICSSKLVSPSASGLNRMELYNSYSILYPSTPITPLCQMHCMCECSNDNRSSTSQQINISNSINHQFITSKHRNQSFEQNGEWPSLRENPLMDGIEDADYIDEMSTTILTTRQSANPTTATAAVQSTAGTAKTKTNENQQVQHRRGCVHNNTTSPKKVGCLNSANSCRKIACPSQANYQSLAMLNSLDMVGELEKILEKQFSPMVNSFMRIADRNERRAAEKDRLELIQNEWADVAMISDHILCYFFPLLTFTICTLIFLNSPHLFSQW